MQENGFLIEDLNLTGLNLKGNLLSESKMNKVCYFQMNNMLNKEYRVYDSVKRYSDNFGIETVVRTINKAYLLIESK